MPSVSEVLKLDYLELLIHPYVSLDEHHSNTHGAKKATIHQVSTMLAMSKNLLFPGDNYLLTIGADNP